MKNLKKFVAAFAAAAMVMSMGVSALAEVVVPAAVEEDDQLTGFTFVIDGTDISVSNEEYITLMAYLIPAKDANGNAYTADTIPAYSNQTIVALDQVGGSAGFGEVPVDVQKLADGEAIAIMLGGSDGTIDQGIIVYAEEENVPVITVTFMNGAVQFATATAVDGEVTLPTTNPTLAADPNYATKSYTFVEWVDENGTAFDATAVNANVTVYPKFKSNITTGDVSNDGKVLAPDRALIHGYVKSKNNADKVGVKVSHLDNKAVTGDVTGDGKVLAPDRALIHGYVKSKNNADKVNVAIYVVNK